MTALNTPVDRTLDRPVTMGGSRTLAVGAALGALGLAGASLTDGGLIAGDWVRAGLVSVWAISALVLAGLTALENVTLPLELDGVSARAVRAPGMAALEELGLADRATHFPDELSGGERQRVAIARAVVGDRNLLLADEPTGALDSEGGQEVIELFRRLHQGGQTILMVTHDDDVAAAAGRIARMKDGKVIDPGDGSVAAV